MTTDSQGEDREELTGVCPTDMDDKAVNYLIKTPGGNIYHSGDSHYSIYLIKNQIDVSGIQKDIFKISYADFYRVGERGKYEWAV